VGDPIPALSSPTDVTQQTHRMVQSGCVRGPADAKRGCREPRHPLSVFPRSDGVLVRDFEGSVRFKRPDAARLKVTALDANGEPLKAVVGAGEVRLGRTILYYLIEPAGSAP